MQVNHRFIQQYTSDRFFRLLFLRLISISFLSLAFFSSFAYGQQNADSSSIYKAALAQLPQVLQTIPSGKEHLFGFSSRKEFKKAELDKPYQVFTFTKDFIDNANCPDRLAITPTGEWRFPVVVRGEFRALVTVVLTNGQWKAVDFGANVLSRELQQLDATLLSDESSDTSKIILRYYQGESDIVVCKSEQEQIFEGEFYPLESAKNFIGKSGRDSKYVYSFQEIRSFIHE
jgi:hypothetical protein